MARRIVSALSAASFMLCFDATNATADEIMARLHAVAQACQPDIQSFCYGIPIGGGRILRCLGANYMSVSTACRETMASTMNDICGEDVARLCPGSTLGSGQAASCLQAHFTELKGTCKEAAARLATK